MPPFSVANDVALLSVVYLILVGGTLGWVFYSKQKNVGRDLRTVVMVSLRLALPVALILVFCAVNNVASWIVVGVAALPFVMVALGGANMGGGNYGTLGALAIVYVVVQYVLGFPDKGEWVLKAEPTSPDESVQEFESQVGRQVTVTQALRPSGHVYIDEQKYYCESDDGCFVEAGAEVVVHAARDGRLVVRKIS